MNGSLIAIIVLVVLIGILIIAIRTVSTNHNTESTSDDNGSGDESSSDSNPSSNSYNPIFGIIGLIGLVVMAILIYAVATSFFTFGTKAITQLSATPPCAPASYAKLVWEGWLEPGQTTHVYDVKIPSGENQVRWTVGWDHDRHPLFFHVKVRGMKTGWAKIPKRDRQLFLDRNGPLELLVAKRDTRTYAKVYILDL